MSIKGVFNDSLTQLVAEADATARITNNRALHVNLRNQAGTEMGTVSNPLQITGSLSVGGTVDSASWTAATSTFTPDGGVFNDSAAALTSGQQGTYRATTNRALHVNLRDHLGNEVTLTGNSLNVNVTNGAAGGTSMADKGAFTVGTTQGTPAFGLVRTDQPDLVVDATGASFASTLRRGLHVNLRTQTGTELLGQKAMAGSIPVALASDQSAIPVTQSGSWSLAANQSVNVAQVNGVTVSTGTGIMGTGVQRVAIASDNDALTVKQGTAANLLCTASQGGTWNIGTVTTVTTVSTVSAVSALTCSAANAKVDIGLINAVTPLMGSGIMGTGSLRVTIASNNDPLAVTQSGTWNIGTVTTLTTCSTVTTLSTLTGGGVANAAADSGNPVKVGGVYTSAPATALATGNRGNLSVGSQNELIVQGLAPVAWFGTQATTITSSVSETTIVTAGAAGVFNDLTLLVITNQSATALIVTLKDSTAGTTRGIFAIAANGGIVIPWHHRLAQATAANNWTITCGTSVASIYVHAHFVTRK